MKNTIKKENVYVWHYQIQRNSTKKYISITRLDNTYYPLSLYLQKILTIEMGHSLSLPNFKGEQPGDTYYMNSLSAPLFGVDNNTTQDKKDKINAYIWYKFEGERG